MLRVLALSLVVFFLAVYARRDWFVSLCGLIVLGAVLEHPDVPKNIANVPGLNLWNLLFLFVFLAWVRAWKQEGLTWDPPSPIGKLLVLYAVLIVVSVIRLLIDDSGIQSYSDMRNIAAPPKSEYFIDLLINSIKFAVPGIMLFTGCRSKSRVYMAAGSILAMYAILALLTIKTVRFDVFTMSGEALQLRAHKVLPQNVGFHRVNLSMLFSGAAWAFFACREMLDNKKARFMLLVLSGVAVLAMASTGGRMGYVTWGMLSVVLIFARWRKLLLGYPLIILAIFTFMPSVVDRLGFGLTEDSAETTTYVDEDEAALYSVTSGRNLAWPLVLQGIQEAPVLGHGREAMRNTGITTQTYYLFGEHDTFAHPHNAYLQWTLDNGLLGLLVILVFYFLIIKYSYSLFRDSRNPIFVGVGGICFSLVGAMLIASMGSQTFYPREGSITLWCAMGLMLRVYVERRKLYSHAPYNRNSSATATTSQSPAPVTARTANTGH